ncbi:cytochrome P450 [Herbidospora mongoliensis]|uniref:cytochrome P450 n=1 Tax=Herbidospora mongoliensis TaxID=688067 RepID=UPI000A069999|nr:cytochrome P450 [Herbidospora mongoliensis]
MSVREVPVELVAARVADPFPYYAWLRERSPVHREVTSRGTVVWQISRYDDVRGLLGDDRLSKCPLGEGRVSGPEGLQRNLVHCDPPDHTRLRRLVNRAFTPARVAALEPLVDKTARELADRLPERCDLIADFAGPLAFGMIKTVLGVPADLETPGLRQLLIDSLAGGRDVTARLHVFLTELLAAKRDRGPVSDTDLLSVLIAAHDDEDGLSEEELLGTAYILLLVGHDTTVNLIGNGMVALLDIASANRDPAQFDRADDLDLGRDPNDHLSLGRGRHFCVGAALARMEARIALPILLGRLGDARLAVPRAALPWRAAPVMRGLEALSVAW